MLKTILRLGLCAGVLMSGAVNHRAVAGRTLASKKAELSQAQLENVHIQGHGIAELFSKLSLTYDIPIGLELTSYDDESTMSRRYEETLSRMASPTAPGARADFIYSNSDNILRSTFHR